MGEWAKQLLSLLNIQLIIQEANQLFISHLNWVGGEALPLDRAVHSLTGYSNNSAATGRNCVGSKSWSQNYFPQAAWISTHAHLITKANSRELWQFGVPSKVTSAMIITTLLTSYKAPSRSASKGVQKPVGVKHMPWEHWGIEDLEVFVFMWKNEKKISSR